MCSGVKRYFCKHSLKVMNIMLYLYVSDILEKITFAQEIFETVDYYCLFYYCNVAFGLAFIVLFLIKFILI